MRLLALHGWRTNKGVLGFQLGALQSSLKRTKPSSGTTGGGRSNDKDWELECLDAPRAASGPPFEAVARVFGSDTPYFEWWDSETAEDGSMTYRGLDESMSFVLAHIEEHGPYDVVMGFSQGSALLSALQAKIEAEPATLASHKRWRLSVFYAGVPLRDTEFLRRYFDSADRLGSMCPTLHVIGDADEFKDSSEVLLRMFQAHSAHSTAVVRHGEGHLPPTLRGSPEQNLEIARSIRQACDDEDPGRLWWAFDFDGVICDSAREVGAVGVKAGHAILPDVFPENLCSPASPIVEGFLVLRSMLEHGYHAVVLCYLMAQALHEREQQGLGSPESASADTIQHVASGLRARVRSEGYGPVEAELAARGFDREAITAAFVGARSAWIDSDKEGWLASNDYYPGMVECVQALLKAGKPVFIITTKGKEFALPLIAQAGLDVPDDRVYGAGMGSKEAVIDALAKSGDVGEHRTCVFVEDLVGTLVRVSTALHCRSILALAAWGYNDEDDADAARKHGFAVHDDPEAFAAFVRGTGACK